MRRRGLFAYVAALAIGLLLSARASIEALMFVLQHRASERVGLAVAGWLVATLAPLALSGLVWLFERRLKAGWLLHILFVPCAIGLTNTGLTMFLAAAGVPDDSSIEGWALFTSDLLLLLTLCIHIGALVSKGLAAMRNQASAG